ncbi:aldo/keto reductase [Mycolicibacterium madagascariense]|uniref:Aldo/keto reductase n=1 Tax=Mycolicibacterium madagascariense TaxID=212765 RepID=A0A7I7XI79_9MYCO|nr:aldo/keto reductase [Mycolicibacterium madagascariense]MCV7010926.1 aldo/keto reductase [Mycolicibacterium madagascariense]BBZ28917.1 aldo/keto reductase [Mycolicibacterium madagascariense]
MQYRTLGGTGVRVSSLCLGAMMFGRWGNPDHDDAAGIIGTALDAGVNIIDTADVYSDGESEHIVGKAIIGRRDDVVLATKVSSPMGEGLNERGASRRWIMTACENSLRRLNTDHIDLYQVHRLDPFTDIDETLGALSDLIRAGKVRYAGSSTFAPSAIVQAQWTAERRHRERFVCEQPPYSLLFRGVEADVLPTCQTHRMGVLVWSPLAGGWLSGRWHRDRADPSSHRTQTMPFASTSAHYDLDVPGNQAKLAAATKLGDLAHEAGLTLIQLALAFVTTHPAVSAAIIGPRTAEHLRDQLSAADVVLEPELLDRIDRIVAPGIDLNPDDAGYCAAVLADPAHRRRLLA